MRFGCAGWEGKDSAVSLFATWHPPRVAGQVWSKHTLLQKIIERKQFLAVEQRTSTDGLAP